MIDELTILDHLKRLGKSKQLTIWIPHELNENKINRRFETSSSLFCGIKKINDLRRKVDCLQPATLSAVVRS